LKLQAAAGADCQIQPQALSCFAPDLISGQEPKGEKLEKMIPVILAGGSGTRLWPMSRKLYPKQLLALTDKYTMLQKTLLRLEGLAGLGAPIVICNKDHQYGTARQLREAGIDNFELILEPEGKNTAPAVAVAALKAVSRCTDELILVLPADHLIQNPAVFHRAVNTAAVFAQKGFLATFGVVPQSPETGYGYIRKGQKADCPSGAGNCEQVFAIEEFVEKPDLSTARQYLASGQYCWNSGMFLFKAAEVLSQIERFAPDMARACMLAVENGRFDGQAFYLDPVAFGQCPSDSIDYAIMEKTDKGVMVPFDAGWNDLGSWAAMWDCGRKDENSNVCKGDVVAIDTKNSLVISENRLVAAVGLKDAVIVETSDAVLVTDRMRSQDVKLAVKALNENNRREPVSNPTCFFPWGMVTEIYSDPKSAVRKIVLDPGKSFEIKSPEAAGLCWNVVSGRGSIIRQGCSELIEQGSCINIDSDCFLQVTAAEDAGLIIMEVCVPATDPGYFSAS
jgi:mannose-1-phosphate guanylyltransferase/mannose-6-phosphate isomerase